MEIEEKACPCGSGMPFVVCCRRYISGDDKPATAEALMRSRYSAYVVGDIDYLVETTLPKMRLGNLRAGYRSTHDTIQWIGLSVLETKLGGEKDKVGKVLFRAFYIQGGESAVHEELSRFRRSGGDWYYVDGQVLDSGS
ncbi:MAG: YchJ family protein [Puniceicoccaceae bacterium]